MGTEPMEARTGCLPELELQEVGSHPSWVQEQYVLFTTQPSLQSQHSFVKGLDGEYFRLRVCIICVPAAQLYIYIHATYMMKAAIDSM